MTFYKKLDNKVDRITGLTEHLLRTNQAMLKTMDEITNHMLVLETRINVREGLPKAPEPNLISSTEVAELAGVTLPAVSNWINRYDSFPKPIQKIGRTKVYSEIQIKRWLENRNTTVIVKNS
jgi:predicted DNA-binding transcriptional regulator AlpA